MRTASTALSLVLCASMLLSVAASWGVRSSFTLRTAVKRGSIFSRAAVPIQPGLTRMMSTKESIYGAGMSGTSTEDTIFALSSGPMTKTGVAVIRLSGPACADVLEELQRVPDKVLSNENTDQQLGQKTPKQPPFPQPRRASLRRLYDPRSGDMLDQALLLWMPGPRSFTGEDVVEIHVHGSRAVVLGVFSALEYLDNPANNRGIRAAERGEFTRRAFDNGRMDLTEIEGLSDLLDADTSLQRKQALKQMDGHLSARFERWRSILLKCLAHTEAVIDFGDDDREDDIDDSAMNPLLPRVQELRDEIEFHLSDGGRGELVREGVRVALAGPPNAGKSSLMNALARRPAAIVSPIAGTTRDIVEVRMELGGVPCIVSDTAGIRRTTDDPIEKEGILRAKRAFQQAQLKVFVGDVGDEKSLKDATDMLASLLAEERDQEQELDQDGETVEAGGAAPVASKAYRALMVLNKADLNQSQGGNNHGPGDSNVQIEKTMADLGVPTFPLSCLTGEGFTKLEAALSNSIKSLLETSTGAASAMGEGTLITRQRHRRHLQTCAERLDSFLEGGLPMDAQAEELRLASLELGKVTGRVDVEELLDIIFRDFCIGK